jgi:arylsulfatase A-like enzyme
MCVTAVLLLFGCADQAPRPRVDHIVLVVLDATHAGHLGCYAGDHRASPNLDALAARGVRFANAFSNTTWTLPSTVSLFTGLRPERHGVVTAGQIVPDELLLLPERLGPVGFTSAAWSHMIFASARHALDQGLDQGRYLRPRDEVGKAEAKVELESFLAAGHERSFTYLHLRRPHSPYEPDDLYRLPFEGDCPLADRSRDKALMYIDNAPDPQLDAADLEHLTHLYRANLRQVDTTVGWLVDLLGDRLSEDTLLVITADHGEELGEHGKFGHRDEVFAEVVRVPLVVVGPGIEPGVVEQAVATVDVTPSLMELVGLPADDELDGTSWAPALYGESVSREPVRIAGRRTPGQAFGAAAVGREWKLTRRADGTQVFHAWRHDAADIQAVEPGLVDASERATLQRIVDELLAWEPQPTAELDAASTTPEELEDLRQLGYVGEER